MKTFIIPLLCILSMSIINGQENRKIYLSTGVDIRNATIGSSSTNNKPSYNGLFRVGVGNKKFDIAIQYEIFPDIHYTALSCQPSYVLFSDQLNRYSIGVELNQIQRINIQEKSFYGEPVFVGTGVNFEYRRTIFNNVDIGLLYNIKTRPDIRVIYKHDDVQLRQSIYFIVSVDIFKPTPK